MQRGATTTSPCHNSLICSYLLELLLEGPVLLVGGGVAIARVRCRGLGRRRTATKGVAVLLEAVEGRRVLLDVKPLLCLGRDRLHRSLNYAVSYITSLECPRQLLRLIIPLTIL